MSRAHTPSSTAKRCSSTGAVCLPLYFLQPCCLHPRASQRPSVPHHTARTSATCVSTLLNWPTRNKVPLKSALTPQQRVFKHAPGAQCLQDHLFDSLQDLLATVIRAEGGDRALLMREFVCKVDEVSVTLRKHLRKEEEQLFPLVLSHFSFDEQAELVVRARPPLPAPVPPKQAAPAALPPQTPCMCCAQARTPRGLVSAPAAAEGQRFTAQGS